MGPRLDLILLSMHCHKLLIEQMANFSMMAGFSWCGG